MDKRLRSKEMNLAAFYMPYTKLRIRGYTRKTAV